MAKIGRPPLFETAEELKIRIDEYFNQCDPHTEMKTEWVEARENDGTLLKDKNGLNYLVEVTHRVMTKQIPYSVTGLALALGMSRQTLLEYEGEVEGREKKDPEFADTIKRAKLRIHNYLELNLYSPSPTGTIFNLKNNFDWKDRVEQELTHHGDVTFINAVPRPKE